MRRVVVNLLGTIVLCFVSIPFVAQTAGAQTGTVAGRVIDSATGAAIPRALIRVTSRGVEDRSDPLISDAGGNFRVSLPAGNHSFGISLIGYEPQRIDDVAVRSGETTELVVLLRSRVLILNPILVSESRGQGKAALDASASVSTIGVERIRERVAVTVADHVRALPGMDVAQTGIQQSSVVMRGFNQVGSGSLMTIVDERYANLPSLRMSALSFLPNPDLDLERMEVLRGPASALYGSNAANGVLHMITASPIDRQGTSVSVATGERSVLQAQFRHARALSERSGLKISGQYFQGEDWHYLDATEAEARSYAVSQGADEDTLLIGRRDFDSRRLSGDMRFDLRPSDDSEVILSAGMTRALSMIELMEVGAGQAKAWTYEYAQARYRHGRLFAQAFVNRSNTGDTYLLRTGEPMVDRSWLLAGQLRHGVDVGERWSLTYGMDLQRTEPRTEGTITGRNEDDDTIDEIGGYLHSETALTSKLDLVAALRVDHHNRLERPNFSPRAALVFQPRPAQTFRLSFNGAFTTPTTNHLFLDLVASRIDVSPEFGFDVRTRGAPAEGFTFEDRCDFGIHNLCMRTPFVPGEQVPANGLLFWNDLVELVAPELLPALAIPRGPMSPPDLQPPRSMIVRLDREVGEFIADPGMSTIRPIRPTLTRSLELGYTGSISDRLTVSADLYHNWVSDYIGPLRVETPTVRFNAESIRDFLEDRLAGQLATGTISPQALDALVVDFSTIPIGTVVPDQLETHDILLTYRNLADFRIWGVDLAAQLLISDRISLAANYSHMSENCFVRSVDDSGICSGVLDVALNAPRNKGSVSLRYDDARRGLALEGRTRIISAFSMNSGPFVGVVDAHALLDAMASYRIARLPGATVSLSGTNVFGRKTQYFLGAPEIGRLLLLRLGYEF